MATEAVFKYLFENTPAWLAMAGSCYVWWRTRNEQAAFTQKLNKTRTITGLITILDRIERHTFLYWTSSADKASIYAGELNLDINSATTAIKTIIAEYNITCLAQPWERKFRQSITGSRILRYGEKTKMVLAPDSLELQSMRKTQREFKLQFEQYLN